MTEKSEEFWKQAESRLHGGRLKKAFLAVYGLFHEEGKLRRDLLVVDTLRYLNAAQGEGTPVGGALIGRAKNALHKPGPANGGVAPYDLCALSTLDFYYARGEMHRRLAKITGVLLQPNPEYQEKISGALDGIKGMRQARREVYNQVFFGR